MSKYDPLRTCPICENAYMFETESACRSCREQQMIDEYDFGNWEIVDREDPDDNPGDYEETSDGFSEW